MDEIKRVMAERLGEIERYHELMEIRLQNLQQLFMKAKSRSEYAQLAQLISATELAQKSCAALEGQPDLLNVDCHGERPVTISAKDAKAVLESWLRETQ